MSRYMVTSALPYANGPLHLGHLAGAYLPADIYVRFLRMMGHEVLFCSGTDEHGVPITITAEKKSGYVVIRLCDTGLGIPEEDLDKIFTRFYRIKSEKTRYIHGTGLGLSIVKSIVEAHHGNIRVESRPNHGSTFFIYLPMTQS